MPEDPEFVRELMIDAGDLFPHIGRLLRAAHKLCAIVRSRENAGFQEHLRIRIQKTRRNGVVRELLSGAESKVGETRGLRWGKLARLRHENRGIERAAVLAG